MEHSRYSTHPYYGKFPWKFRKGKNGSGNIGIMRYLILRSGKSRSRKIVHEKRPKSTLIYILSELKRCADSNRALSVCELRKFSYTVHSPQRFPTIFEHNRRCKTASFGCSLFFYEYYPHIFFCNS